MWVWDVFGKNCFSWKLLFVSTCKSNSFTNEQVWRAVLQIKCKLICRKLYLLQVLARRQEEGGGILWLWNRLGKCVNADSVVSWFFCFENSGLYLTFEVNSYASSVNMSKLICLLQEEVVVFMSLFYSRKKCGL